MMRFILLNLGEFTRQNFIKCRLRTSLRADTDRFCQIGNKFPFEEEKELFYICRVTA